MRFLLACDLKPIAPRDCSASCNLSAPKLLCWHPLSSALLLADIPTGSFMTAAPKAASPSKAARCGICLNCLC